MRLIALAVIVVLVVAVLVGALLIWNAQLPEERRYHPGPFVKTLWHITVVLLWVALLVGVGAFIYAVAQGWS